MRSTRLTTDAGFTFVEVLVAMVILVLAILSAVRIAQGSVAAIRDSKQMSVATWLVEQSMVELETAIETDGVEKGCEKKKEGKFDAYEGYTWITYCDQIDLNLSETASKIAGGDSGDSTQENLMQKMILQTVSDYMSKSMRELHAEVYWTFGKQKKKVSLTTHFVKYDEPLKLPGFGGGTDQNQQPQGQPAGGTQSGQTGGTGG